MTYDVDGNVECEACSAAVEERRRWLGAAVLAWIGVGYLAALAVAVLVFHKRPFVGGLAAIVALGLGRALQSYVHPPVISRRT